MHAAVCGTARQSLAVVDLRDGLLREVIEPAEMGYRKKCAELVMR